MSSCCLHGLSCLSIGQSASPYPQPVAAVSWSFPSLLKAPSKEHLLCPAPPIRTHLAEVPPCLRHGACNVSHRIPSVRLGGPPGQQLPRDVMPHAGYTYPLPSEGLSSKMSYLVPPCVGTHNGVLVRSQHQFPLPVC